MSKKNKNQTETQEPEVNEKDFSPSVRARRERLAKTVGDASDETDGKQYGVTDRKKREDERG